MKTDQYLPTPHSARSSLGIGPLVLSAVSFFFILLGVASVLFFQPELQTQNFDTRKQASVVSGPVTLSPSFQDATATNPQASINLQVNTSGIQTDGVQVVFNVITPTFDTLTVNVPAGVGLQAVHQEVQKTSDGFLVSLIAVPQTLGQTFSSTTPVTFATLTFTPHSAGTITLAFDQENSFSTIHGTNPPQDGLVTIPQLNFTTTGPIVLASPSPSPSPSPTPSITPAPSPTPLATPSPSPSPSPTLAASPSVGSCNASCSSNAGCDVNMRCYYGQCRLATNPSSTTCVNPPDQGLQRQCNEYCADSRDCANGLTCFYNQCRSADNPDSSTCSSLSNAASQSIQLSCNTSCSSNKDCAVNLRCYSGQCRLATNPSSLSCSSMNSSSVSSLYGEKGQEIPPPAVTPQPSPSETPSMVTLYPNTSTVGKPAPSSSFSPSNWLTSLTTWFADHGLSFPFIAVTSGIVLLILALLVFLASRRKTGPQKIAVSSTSSTPPAYEQSLQAKIDALRKAQHAQTHMNTDTQVSTHTHNQVTHPGKSPTDVASEKLPIPPAPTPEVPPLNAINEVRHQTPEPDHRLTMMERVKQKGLMTSVNNKIPNPTAPSPTQNQDHTT